MFAVNFKKDWRMNKSMFITTFSLIFLIFIANMIFYLLIRYLNFSNNVTTILNAIWIILASLSSFAGQILVIVLIYFLIKKDLGKNNIHNTIFTPQSLFSWLLPKIVYVFIIQGLFVLVNLIYSYLLLDIANKLDPSGQTIQYGWKENIVSFLTTTFNFGLFALILLWMALYYSFRKKGISWLLIIISSVTYFLSSQAFSIYKEIQKQLHNIQYEQATSFLVDYGIKNVVGLIFIFISLYLFNKKIEY